MTFFIYGLLVGSVYGLWAFSFSLIYRTTGIFHVVHAGVFTAAAYLCWYVSELTGSLLIGLAAGLIAGTLLGVASEKFLYSPLLRKKVALPLLFVASLGVYIIIENLAHLLWKSDTRFVVLPAMFDSSVSVAGASMSVLELGEALLSLALWGLALFLLWTTNLGKAFRAITTSPDLAELSGVNVKKIRLLVFASASLVISMSGIMFMFRLGIEPSSGLPVWIAALVASLMSRASFVGSYLVGLALGVGQTVALLWVAGTWQPVIPVLALILYLAASYAMTAFTDMRVRRMALRERAHA